MHTRSEAESQPKDPYNDFFEALKPCYKKYNLDVYACDAFEAFILKFAEVEAIPIKCRFARHPEQPDYCYFVFAVTDVMLDNLPKDVKKEEKESLRNELNNKCVKKLLKLNETTPQLQVAEIKNRDADEEEHFPSELARTKTFIVWMKVEALTTFFVPRFETFLSTNPEFVRNFERYSFTTEQVFEEMKALCDEHLIHRSTHCLEDILCYLIKFNSESAAISRNFLQTMYFNKGLIGLIHSYVGTREFQQDELNELKPENINFLLTDSPDNFSIQIDTTSLKTAHLLSLFLSK